MANKNETQIQDLWKYLDVIKGKELTDKELKKKLSDINKGISNNKIRLSEYSHKQGALSRKINKMEPSEEKTKLELLKRDILERKNAVSTTVEYLKNKEKILTTKKGGKINIYGITDFKVSRSEILSSPEPHMLILERQKQIIEQMLDSPYIQLESERRVRGLEIQLQRIKFNMGEEEEGGEEGQYPIFIEITQDSIIMY